MIGMPAARCNQVTNIVNPESASASASSASASTGRLTGNEDGVVSYSRSPSDTKDSGICIPETSAADGTTTSHDEEYTDTTNNDHTVSSTEDKEADPAPYQKFLSRMQTDRRWKQDISLGRRIGFYRIRGEIGAGNFSVVKMAVHQITKERVAIKILDKSKLDQKTRRMLSREIANIEGIQHPNIIRLYEVLETFSKIHLVLEYAAGGELFHKISTIGRLPETEARIIFGQIVGAVRYLHERGIVHRDIKAENVFCAGPTLVKLGDLGFSTQLTEGWGQQLNTFCGSPPYAAPELFRDESYCGPPVDVWALGVLLVFIVTGQMPFKAPTVAALKRAILEGIYTLPAHVSASCANLTAMLLRPVPTERPSLENAQEATWLRLGPSRNLPPDQPFATKPTPDGGVDSLEIEAREKLSQLGLDEGTLEAEARRGVRSPAIGTYRIMVHRLQKAAQRPEEFPATDDLNDEVEDMPGGVASAPVRYAAPVVPTTMFRKTRSATVAGTTSSARTRNGVVKSRACSLL